MNIALLLTASAISLNTASSAGSVFSPPRSDGPEFMTIESDQSDAAVSATIYTPVSALPSAQSISAGNGSFEARLDLMMTDLPVDAGNAAMAPIAALPNDEIPLAPAQTALASVVVTDAVATMPAALLPVIAAETLPAMGASLAVMPIPKIATEQAAALPDVAPVMDATPVANPVEQAALVITALPKSDAAEAVFLHPVSAHSAAKMAPAIAPPMPQYTFFEDAPVPAVSPISAAAAGAGMVYGSENVTLEQAISAALETNPEVNQAIMNKEAIEFEREQAQGLYLPRVDIEASAGVRRLENNTRRSLGISDEVLYPLEAGISAEQVVVDFGRRHGEPVRLRHCCGLSAWLYSCPYSRHCC